MKRSGFSGHRKRLKPVSDKRRADFDRRREERAAVMARDDRCRLEGVEGAGPCWGPPEMHEIRKASQGGRYDRENGARLCCSHNQRLESDADLAALARSLGLVLKAGDQPPSPPD